MYFFSWLFSDHLLRWYTILECQEASGIILSSNWNPIQGIHVHLPGQPKRKIVDVFPFWSTEGSAPLPQEAVARQMCSIVSQWADSIAAEQRPHPDPPKLREGRREAEIPIFQYYPSSATSCRNLAAARRHPIHTYESLWSSCRIQAGLLGTDRKAPNVFAARGGCWHPCTRASCTSPAPNVTTPGNVTFYRLLGVTLSRWASGTIPSHMGTALRNFPGL